MGGARLRQEWEAAGGARGSAKTDSSLTTGGAVSAGEPDASTALLVASTWQTAQAAA